ncbi:hypothetical protein QTO34_000367 [Cnephaeus nilssonii]|uniref:Uncharacterized protein n=1 Tax=Cnephaeus nilssonii TaxID=3371016 RepID=A0AA40IBW1_CNENI|nr:hypothetical protein QTO34_000367 [Eptesicus nilssonii]
MAWALLVQLGRWSMICDVSSQKGEVLGLRGHIGPSPGFRCGQQSEESQILTRIKRQDGLGLKFCTQSHGSSLSTFCPHSVTFPVQVIMPGHYMSELCNLEEDHQYPKENQDPGGGAAVLGYTGRGGRGPVSLLLSIFLPLSPAFRQPRAVVGKLQLASHMRLFGPLSVALPQNTTAWASLF